jgi:hypothetical protein
MALPADSGMITWSVRFGQLGVWARAADAIGRSSARASATRFDMTLILT